MKPQAKETTVQIGTSKARGLYKILYVQVLFAIALGVVVGHLWPALAVEMKPVDRSV
jgi:aerobic C4-dicarboxylate transport protein